jgi:hypothetical protein
LHLQISLMNVCACAVPLIMLIVAIALD